MTKPLSQTLEHCKNGQEFIREIRNNPAITSAHWSGDHLTVHTALGRVTLCNHRREMHHGLRKRIVAGLISIGLCGFILLITFAPLFNRT